MLPTKKFIEQDYDYDDMASIDDLTEETVLLNIRNRYSKNKIYVSYLFF